MAAAAAAATELIGGAAALEESLWDGDDDDDGGVVDDDERAIRNGMYRRAVDGLVSNLVLAVGVAVNLAGNFQQFRHQYFLHMIVLLAAAFIATVALRNSIGTWRRVGDRTLYVLWYSFMLRCVSVFFTIISLAVAQTVVQKVQQYLNPSVVLTASFASRFISLTALVAFALTALDYTLQAPAAHQQRRRRRPKDAGDVAALELELAALRRRVERVERSRPPL